MHIKYLVIGSGIGGLSAGAELKRLGIEDFKIVDQCQSVPLNLHNGVHYLHSIDFKLPFEFEFQEIRSKEQIWHPIGNIWKNEADIPEINEYGIKAFDVRHPSSIQDPGSRNWKTFVPLSNNMNDLLSGFYSYIGEEHFEFGAKLSSIDKEIGVAYFEKEGSNWSMEYEFVVSTVPLNCLDGFCQIKIDKPLEHRTVFVTNYKTTGIIPNWLISIYIPDKEFPPYRITLLNNIISMESGRKLTLEDEHIIKYHLGRHYDYEIDTKNEYEWSTGRIWGLRPWERKKIMDEFNECSIYPIGRYGQWNGKLVMDSTITQAQEVINKII
jgi:hypothetical protein